MRFVDPWASALLFTLVACGGAEDSKPEPPPRNIGHQTADIVADTRLLREASAAVNEVIRNQDDCAAARPAIAAATKRIDEANRRVRTAVGRTSLAALQAQLGNVAQICP